MKKLRETSLMKCKLLLRVTATICAALVTPGGLWTNLEAGQAPAGPAPQQSQLLNPEQLASLVAPIALYPDALLAQILAASTYPLDIVEANRWLQSNSSLKGDALVQAAATQEWEASVQALVVFPDVLNRMDQNLKWTTALGNAFLAQESDVMAAVQSMRGKAQAAGGLTSNSQQKVEDTSQAGQKVIVIQPANPQVIYVPTYNPIVVYGPPPVYYPYPVMVYPPPPSSGAIIAASMISFGVGIALGAAFHGCCAYGGWGWGCNWGGRSVTINTTFVSHYRLAPMPYARVSGTTVWAHNPSYRGTVPYSSAAVAGRYGAAAGVRTPYGAAGAAVGPRGGVAAGAVGPNGARGAVATPYGSAQGVRTQNGSAGAVSTRNGNAAAVKTPYGSAVKTPAGTYSSSGTVNRAPATSQPKNWGSWNNSGSTNSSSSRSAFAGNQTSKTAQTASNRGFNSMNGAAGTRSNGRQ